MKLKTRMLVIILGSIFLILAGLLVYVGNSNEKNEMNSAKSLAKTSGEKIAGSVQMDLQGAMDTARTLANTFQSMKMGNTTSRSEVSGILKRVLEDNPTFLGTWTLWEPNAFDGKDSEFANTEESDQTGRLMDYWNRNGSTLSRTILKDYDRAGDGDYYLLAKESGEETILNPFT